mmetsp:Transcript_60443/g.141540  ORF Transcript_60443/g.141540 Transcript_60443/m.141540 type:complete len:336 (-) Transcript_60443:607-1614(-)
MCASCFAVLDIKAVLRVARKAEMRVPSVPPAASFLGGVLIWPWATRQAVSAWRAEHRMHIWHAAVSTELLLLRAPLMRAPLLEARGRTRVCLLRPWVVYSVSTETVQKTKPTWALASALLSRNRSRCGHCCMARSDVGGGRLRSVHILRRRCRSVVMEASRITLVTVSLLPCKGCNWCSARQAVSLHAESSVHIPHAAASAAASLLCRTGVENRGGMERLMFLRSPSVVYAVGSPSKAFQESEPRARTLCSSPARLALSHRSRASSGGRSLTSATHFCSVCILCSLRVRHEAWTTIQTSPNVSIILGLLHTNRVCICPGRQAISLADAACRVHGT